MVENVDKIDVLQAEVCFMKKSVLFLNNFCIYAFLLFTSKEQYYIYIQQSDVTKKESVRMLVSPHRKRTSE